MTTQHILYPPKNEPGRIRKSNWPNHPTPATVRGRRIPSRHPDGAAPVRIAPLYQELLKELDTAGYMRTDQMEQMLRLIAVREHWPLPEKSLRRVVQKKLLAMVKAGIVRRIVPPIFPNERTGPPFYIYTLAKAGAGLVAEYLGMTLQEMGWRPVGDESFLFFNHTLALVDYRLTLFEACLVQNVELS